MAQQNEVTDMKYAGFWLRVIASMIDGVILTVVVLLYYFVIQASFNEALSGAEVNSAGSYAITLLEWLYFAVSESSSWQATLGKKIIGLKVTDLEGDNIGFGKATVRHLAKIISSVILCIGFIMVAFTKRKQGLHDILAKTLVVKKA